LTAKIYNHHCQRLGICAKGRREMAEKIGYDYQDFIKNGLDINLAKKLFANDAQGLELIEFVEKNAK
jgi:hypothetical protein